MSFKLVFLTAAAALVASPAAAGAQITGSRVNPGVQTNDRAEAERDRAAQAAAERTEAEPDVDAAAAADAEAATEAEAGPVAPITAAEVRAGMAVVDTEGGRVGTIESVEADGAIVVAGEARAKLPFESFGKRGNALVITMSRAELQAAVDARTPG